MTSTVSKALKNIVAERDSYTCVLCENGYTDVHHVTPRSRGGRNNPYNLVCLCRKCHMAIHREIPATDEWLEDAEQRLTEYTADFYAEEIESGSFTPIGFIGHRWDKDRQSWEGVYE